MISKAPSNLLHAAGGLGAAALRRLPWRACLAAGAALGRLAGTVLVRKSFRTRENLARAGLPASRAAAREVWAALGRTLLEMLWLTGQSPAGIEGRMRVEGIGALLEAARRGRGVLLVSAHVGNWELVPVAAARAGLPITVVARALRVSRVERWLVAFRRRCGVRTLMRGQPGASVAAFRQLRRGGVLGCMMDRASSGERLTVPFLGAGSSLPLGPARLACRTGAAVVLGDARRGPDGLTVVGFRTLSEGEEADPVDLSRRIGVELEKSVRASPGEWFWIQRRQPRAPGEAALAGGSVPAETPARPAWRVRLAGAAALLALTAMGLTLFLHDLGGIDLLDPDETRYAASARAMMESGDYVIPRFNGEMRLQKPPLFYWAQTLAFRAFGVGEFGARLPSALAALALAALVTAFAWRESGRRVALAAGAILVTFPLFFVTGRAAITDMTLALPLCGSLLLYYTLDRRAREGRRAAGPAGALAVGALLGAGFLAKGPVGVLVPALVIAAYHVALGEWRTLLRWRAVLAGLLAAAAVAGPWVALAIGRAGRETLESVALRETVERYAATGLKHPEAWWYFLLVMGVAMLPWSAFLLPAAVRGTGRALRGRDRLETFLWMWIAVTLAFFSLGRGKVPTYILPLLPAAAIYLGRRWSDWSRPREAEAAGGAVRRRGIDADWLAAILLLVPLAAAIFVFALQDGGRAEAVLPRAGPLLVLLAAALLATAALSARRRRLAVVPVLAGAFAFFYVYSLHAGGGELAHARSLGTMVREARLDERPDVRLAVYANFHPSLVFYARRHVKRLDTPVELERFLREPGGAIVVMDERRHAALGPRWDLVLTPLALQGDQVALEKLTEPAWALFEGGAAADEARGQPPSSGAEMLAALPGE